MSEDLFGDIEEETEVGAPAEIPETFESQTTARRSFSAEQIPLFTHEPMKIPASDLNVDLSGNDAMQSIDDILAGIDKE